MSKSTQKIVAGLLSVAMVLTLVVGLTVTFAGAQTVTYTRSLTVGSRGADVTALQTYLQAQGFFTVTPTGYFGTITKRAVAAWQASVGITPAAGYFGPISRAQLNTGKGGTTPPPVSGVPGCPAGAVYNYLTGALCSTPNPSTSTTEGSLTVTAAATPANNANIQTNTDVPVYGLQLKAQLADVTINRLDLDISDTAGAVVENPGNFVQAIKLLDGSTVLKTWSVSSSDFIQGTTTNDWYVRLSNIGYVVPKDTTKTLTVAITTNGGIDTARVVVLHGYGTNSLLATSGNNIVSYYDVSTIIRTHTFNKPGTSNLTVASDASNPLSTTVRVNHASANSTNVTMMTFSAKSDTGDSKITSVTVLATSSAASNGPSALYLYDGSTLVSSWSAATWAAATPQTATFSNLSLVVPSGTTKTLTITADLPNTTADATIASTTVSSVVYQRPNSTSVTLSPNIAGNNQYFYAASPQWTLLSATPSLLTTGGTNNNFQGTQVTFVLKVTPVGGSITNANLPSVLSFTNSIVFRSAKNLVGTTSTTTAVVVSGNPTTMVEGQPYTVSVSATVGSTSLGAGINSGWFQMLGGTSTITNGSQSTTTIDTWGFSNFTSAPVTYTQ